MPGHENGRLWQRQAMKMAVYDYDRLLYWQAMLLAVYNPAVLSLQSFSVPAVGAQSVVRFDTPTLNTLRQMSRSSILPSKVLSTIPEIPCISAD